MWFLASPRPALEGEEGKREVMLCGPCPRPRLEMKRQEERSWGPQGW